MKKSPAPARVSSRRRPARRPAKREIAAAAALERLRGIEPRRRKGARVIALLRSWLEDESGYDEETWPQLKKSLNEERSRVRARKLVNG